jgi:hypothetical protein
LGLLPSGLVAVVVLEQNPERIAMLLIPFTRNFVLLAWFYLNLKMRGIDI